MRTSHSFQPGWKWVSIFLVAIFLFGMIAFTPFVARAGSSGSTFDYVVTILMENKGINASYNCGGNCTYITQLANTYGLAESYSALTHPSMGNYIALTSGSLVPLKNDTLPPGSVKSANIVDSLEASGLTWKAYLENYHGSCSDNGSQLYADDHNPFVKYADIYNSTARCARIVNAGSDAGNSSSVFLADLASPSAPNYMWLTPNLCHDMHSCSVSTGNSYLANLVPKILGSYIFIGQRAALFITFDEGCCSFPKDYVTTIWAGPVAKQGYRSTVFYDHYSYLRTVENNWGLPALTANDTDATPMNEFFATKTTPPPPPEPQPLIFGWGGILAVGSVHFNADNPPSVVFPGQQASNTEVTFAEMKSRGYNGARVSIIDPGNQPDSNTFNSNAWRRTLTIADHFGFYIVGDDHEYSIISSWLPFWRAVIQETPQAQYPNVLWEAQNEPHDANLTVDFQSFVNMDRSLGDTRWIVLGCNNDCTPTGASDAASLSAFPVVNDTINHVFYDFHEYYFYPEHSSAWNVSAAVAFADAKFAGVQNVIKTLRRPFLGTEWGAETGCSSCAPDQTVPGSAGYAPETLAYLTEIVKLSRRASIGYTIWNAGDWNDRPAGKTGALDTFGQFLPLPNGTVIQPPPSPRSLLFAYGSDTLESVVESGTNNTATFVDTARVDGYSFAIDHTSINGTGTGDMVLNARDFVEGVVYSIPQSSLTLLDRAEGGPTSYRRIDGFNVTSLTTGQTLRASVYRVISPETNAPPPSGEYKSEMLNGITQHSLGQAYYNKIISILVPAPPAPPPILVGDINKDGVVNFQDLILCLENQGATGPNVADVNHDGIVNLQDIVLILSNFTG